MEKRKVWMESKAAAEASLAQANEDIFAACYAKSPEALDVSIRAWRKASRAVAGWDRFFEMSEEDVVELAKSKAAAQAVKQAEKRGKHTADVMQYSEDAAQEALLHLYTMDTPTEYGPESILSFKAGEYISAAMYRGLGRNGREDRIDAESPEALDGYLYNNHVFGPGPEEAILKEERIDEAIQELKEKHRAEARLIIDALRAGFTQEEIAITLGCTQSKISKRLAQLKAAAEIARKNDAESSSLLRQIESDENILGNLTIRNGQRRPR